MTSRGRLVVRVAVIGTAIVVGSAVVLAVLRWSGAPPLAAGEPKPTPSSIAPSPTAAPTSTLDPTGILLVQVGEQIQAGHASEAVERAFDQALNFAMANPHDIGYPWIDLSNGELVVSAATSHGRVLLETASIAVPHRIRDVPHSYAELQGIQEAATHLVAAGVTDGELVYKIVPDQRDNLTLIVVSRMSRPLLEELARRFGADAIAVQVDPNQPQAGT